MTSVVNKTLFNMFDLLSMVKKKSPHLDHQTLNEVAEKIYHLLIIKIFNPAWTYEIAGQRK